jgi:GT2 family glycosyltransferase
MSERVAAMVLARDRAEPLERTLRALEHQTRRPDLTLVIDNDGTDEVHAVIAAADGVEVLSLAHNLGCAGGFEAGERRLLEDPSLDYVVGFDDDAEPEPACVEELLGAAAQLPALGAAGALSHDGGTLAWPMYLEDEREPLETIADVEAAAARRATLPVMSLSWHGLLWPAQVLRDGGIVWGDLFLQTEDIELGMRLRARGLHLYLVPAARSRHPKPPPTRVVRVLGRRIDVTAQNVAKEHLTLRNGIVVRRRHEPPLRFWTRSLPALLLRGVLSAVALRAFRPVVVRGVADGLRGRLGPPRL